MVHPGASGHVTAKSSFCNGVCFINLAFTQGKFCVLPREICAVFEGAGLRAERSDLTAVQKSAEGIVEAASNEGPNGFRSH